MLEAERDFLVTSTAKRNFIKARWFDASNGTRVFLVNSFPNHSINLASKRSPPRVASNTFERGTKSPSRIATTDTLVEVPPTSSTTAFRSRFVVVASSAINVE